MIAKTVPIDENFNQMLTSAVRYAIGRRTYITSTTVDYVIPLIPSLDTRTLLVMKRDINLTDDLGDENIDAPHWIALLEAIKAELDKRKVI